MKKVRRAIAALAVAIAVLTGGTVWQLAFRTPADDPAPLPPHLVALTAPEGRRMLAESAGRADYPSLSAAFEPQRRPAYCGVASSVAVLNALRPGRPRLTQASVLPDLATEIRVTFTGMTLQELGDLLRRHGAEAQVVHAADTNLDGFRATARATLARDGDYIIVNYDRASLGQRQSGHISPLAAYHPADDRFLVLDVAADRYPPTWVAAADLWRAMHTVDSTSGRTRGFVVVSARSVAGTSLGTSIR